MRNTNNTGRTLPAIKFGLPEPLVIELDDEAGRIAFRAAERELVQSGFGEMDLMAEAAPRIAKMFEVPA